jgi:hypothetical protein
MATSLEAKVNELHAVWGDRGLFLQLLPLSSSQKKDFTEIAQGILSREVAEGRLREQQERLYNSSYVRCVLPDNQIVVIPGSSVREQADKFMIAPNGEYFVCVAKAFFNFFAPSYTYPNGVVKKCTISWTLIKDPIDWSSAGRAIEGVDYSAHGFVMVSRTFKAPHHAEYDPIANRVGWWNVAANEYEFS